MNDLYSLIITSIAGLSTILGNVLLFIDIKYKDKLIAFSLGLSFMVMFLISIVDLIPSGIKLVYYRFSVFYLFIISIFLLYFGYLIVTIIDRNISNEDNLYKIGILSMISLLIHNIPEGMICAITSSTNIHLGLKMSFIILIHNIPEGICISLPIYYATGSRGKAFLYTIISGMGEICGALITLFLLKNLINDYVLFVIFLITAGIMITLSTLKIYKEGINLSEYKYFILGIIIGIIIIIMTM